MPFSMIERIALDGIAVRLRDALRQVEGMAHPERYPSESGWNAFDAGPSRRFEAFHGERPGPLALVFRQGGVAWTEREARELHAWLGEQFAKADARADARLAGQDRAGDDARQ